MTTPTTPPPSGAIHFPLQGGEQVLMVCRRHWFYLYPRLVIYLLAAAVPLGMLAFVLSKADAFHGTGRNAFVIVSAVWLLYWAIRALFTWYKYVNDLWVITN